MKILKKALGLFLCLFFMPVFGQSQEMEMEDVFSTEIISELRKNKKISNYSYINNTQTPKLCPKAKKTELSTTLWTNKEEKPSVLLEGLYYFKKENQKEIDLKKIEKILVSISKMEGMKYYSNRRKKELILYPTFYRIDNYEQKNKIPDLVTDELNGKEILVFQEDDSFGEYVASVKYFIKENSVGFVSTNLDTIGFSIFKGADVGDMKIYLQVVDFGDEVVIYTLLMTLFPKYPGMEKNMQLSLSARIDALSGWFINIYKNGGKNEN